MDKNHFKTVKRNRWMAISIGFVYFWFGALKFVPDLSPAEALAKNTIHHLTFGLIPDEVSIILLAFWEVGLGSFLILGLFRKQMALAALVHMACTFTPLIFFPNDVFGEAPLSLTLVGQYIMKNIIIMAALLSIYGERSVHAGESKFRTNLRAVQPFRLSFGKNLFKKV